MTFALESSAPHITTASRIEQGLADWGQQPDCLEGPSLSSGKLLHKGPGGIPEVGIWRCTPGRWPLSIGGEELCYFGQGRATYQSDSGEVIDIEPDSLVHFKAGWKGHCTVRETLQVTYMLCEPGQSGPTPHLRQVQAIHEVKDWGAISTMIEGESRTSGVLLSREPDGKAESGIWICTPGLWHCHVTRDELCHFLVGRCTYTHESGEVIEITPDTAAFFPQDWKGTCRVHETVRKIYMIR